MDKISIVIPAYNEELYISKCLKAIDVAKAKIDIPVETIVVLNRCTDRTEDIALEYGALIVKEDKKNLARIRNAAVEASTGDILMTIDADSMMSENMLQEVLRRLNSGKFIGGGVSVKFERMSIGIFFSVLRVAPYMLKAGVSAGMFWLYKRDFETVGGFDEHHGSVEDYQFAIKLKAYGKQVGLKYGTIMKSNIITSSRKFDQFGDWYLYKNPQLVKEIFTGCNQQAADGFYYNICR